MKSKIRSVLGEFIKFLKKSFTPKTFMHNKWRNDRVVKIMYNFDKENRYLHKLSIQGYDKINFYILKKLEIKRIFQTIFRDSIKLEFVHNLSDGKTYKPNEKHKVYYTLLGRTNYRIVELE